MSTSTPCIPWSGRIDANGYGRLGGGWAHRKMYERQVAPIPVGHELDHICNRRDCVNVEHLEVVTRGEHCARTMRRLGKDDLHLGAAYLRSLGMTYADIADALGLAGRSSASEAVKSAIRKGLIDPTVVPPTSRLSDQDADDIRALRALGVPLADIACWYGIDQSHASRLSRKNAA